MMKHVLWCVALAMVSGCGPAGSGGTGGGSGGGNGSTNNHPNFTGHFTFQRQSHNDGAGQDRTENGSFELVATFDNEGTGWKLAGTASVNSVTQVDARCSCTGAGSVSATGGINVPHDPNFLPNWVDGAADWLASSPGGDYLTLNCTELVANSNCGGPGWAFVFNTHEADAADCTRTEFDIRYNDGQGWNTKLSYSCAPAGGDTRSGTISGSWLPN